MDSFDSTPVPDFVLVVIHPFADYQKGQRIEQAEDIAAVLGGECAHCVVKTPA